MKKVAIILADGFEELEALSPKDVLNRVGIQADLVTIKSEKQVQGANGVTVIADDLLDNVNIDSYDAIVLPGGMPGALNLSKDERVINTIKKFDQEEKIVGAICAAPALVISKSKIALGRRVTSYPGMEDYLQESEYVNNELVVRDNNLITSRGPATALAFAYKLVEALGIDANSVKQGMLYDLL